MCARAPVLQMFFLESGLLPPSSSSSLSVLVLPACVISSSKPRRRREKSPANSLREGLLNNWELALFGQQRQNTMGRNRLLRSIEYGQVLKVDEP